MAKSPLYSGSYHVRSRRLLALARANPATRCMSTACRYGNGTLAQHPAGSRWSAGHAWPNDPHAPLQPEILGCNVSEGNKRRRNNEPHTLTWR
jgi:hypothetical protein